MKYMANATDGQSMMCIMTNDLTGLFHGVRLEQSIDDGGNMAWTERYATKGYDTIEAARSHIVILYPDAEEIIL